MKYRKIISYFSLVFVSLSFFIVSTPEAEAIQSIDIGISSQTSSTVIVNGGFKALSWTPQCIGGTTYGLFPRHLDEFSYDIINPDNGQLVREGRDLVVGDYEVIFEGDYVVSCPANFGTNPSWGTDPEPYGFRQNEFNFNGFSVDISGLAPGNYEVSFTSSESPESAWGPCDEERGDPLNSYECDDYHNSYTNDPGVTFTIPGDPGNPPPPEPGSGTIQVVSNISTSWIIDGPEDHAGSGTSGQYVDTAIGSYTIYPADIACYSNPSISPSSTQSLADGETKTFTLNYVNDGSCGTPPPTVDIKFNNSDGPVNILSGASGIISWTVTNATSCVASNGWSGSKNSGGGNEGSGALDDTVTYVLTCTGAGGTDDDSVTVNMNNQLPSGSLDAANCSIIGGWAYDPDASSEEIEIRGYKDGPVGVGSSLFTAPTNGLRPDVNNAFGITGNHGYAVFTPASLKDGTNHTVHVYAVDYNVPSLIQLIGSATVNCPSTLSVTLQVRDNAVGGAYLDGPITIAYGGRVDLQWTPGGASSCDASNAWSGSKTSTGGTETTSSLIPPSPKTFTITCVNGSGGTVNDSVTVNVNNPVGPNNPVVSVAEPNYCVSGPAATISWVYSSPNGSSQTAYQVQIDNQGSFNSPEIDTGKVVSSSTAYTTSQGVLQFNITYNARVRYWNQQDVASSWATVSSCSGPGCQGNSWKTPSYAYPQVDFTWAPTNPLKNSPINFTDQTVFGFSGGTKEWSWNFGDNTSSTQQNPTKTYTTESSYYVTLTATDNADQACNRTKGPLIIQQQIPIWIEVAPR